MEQFANNASTTLNGSINNSTTSVVVGNATGFPASGNFRIIVESEIMLVTAVSGNTFTVTRGSESTTAASHNSGVGVKHILTAGAVQQYRADNIAIGGVASLPAAGTAGRVYYSTDDVYAFCDNGSAWNAIGPIYQFTPPTNTGFSWVNQGTASVTLNTNGSLYFRTPGQNIGYIHRVMSAPSAPYTVTMGAIPLMIGTTGADQPGFGLTLRDSSTGKLVIYVTETNPSGGSWASGAFTYTNNTTFNSIYQKLLETPYPTGVSWFQIKDDNTNRHFNISTDGHNWETFFSISRTDWITPDQIGFLLQDFQTDQPQAMTVVSWKITQP